MANNCETFILTKETCGTLLQAVDKNLTEKFMPLWNLGWCSYYHLEIRLIKYSDKKTQIIEFYWLDRKVLDHEMKGCNSRHCCAFLFYKFNKMTLTQVKISFGKFFRFFFKYWNCVLNRENRESYEIFVEMALIYEQLLKEWTAAKWCVNELRWICSNLYYNVSLFDPEPFLNYKKSYVVHLKNCYYLNSESYGE